MSGAKWHSVASMVLLAWLSTPAGSQELLPAMRRLPPIERGSAPSATRSAHRISTTVQASALLGVDEAPERMPARAAVEPAPPDNLEELLPRSPGVPESLGTLSDEIGLRADIWLADYLIQPGDDLEVKFRVTPDLNETVTVRPDGMISLQIVGDVIAANQTPEALRHALIEAFQGTLKDPELVVIVRRFSGNHVFVGGEVQAPGRIAISGQITALQAVILAGGFKDSADKKRVILRDGGGGYARLNLHAEIKHRIVGHDVLLRPGDVIFVPKSRIAKVNLFVEQYIDKVLPFQRSFGVFISKDLSNTN